MSFLLGPYFGLGLSRRKIILMILVDVAAISAGTWIAWTLDNYVKSNFEKSERRESNSRSPVPETGGMPSFPTFRKAPVAYYATE